MAAVGRRWVGTMPAAVTSRATIPAVLMPMPSYGTMGFRGLPKVVS